MNKMTRSNKYIRQKTQNKLRLLKLEEYSNLLSKISSSTYNELHKRNNIRFLQNKIKNINQFVF